ncbi:hypothetical protein C0Q70_21627 [Pomacea canaliculata]|uniref:Uncharacterized protein n=1 Tax=Pomacea canaliculata TaxID=400727 RepID=A0A2T7ND13_POMCA|nr:hypothetical protein C0Q70_21627 [Pomacea canaliculata]
METFPAAYYDARQQYLQQYAAAAAAPGGVIDSWGVEEGRCIPLPIAHTISPDPPQCRRPMMSQCYLNLSRSISSGGSICLVTSRQHQPCMVLFGKFGDLRNPVFRSRGMLGHAGITSPSASSQSTLKRRG